MYKSLIFSLLICFTSFAQAQDNCLRTIISEESQITGLADSIATSETPLIIEVKGCKDSRLELSQDKSGLLTSYSFFRKRGYKANEQGFYILMRQWFLHWSAESCFEQKVNPFKRK